ncbi:hypothetical protein MalM25_17290 [Planctomycetes bacterium MalM25]|nr:hypothetical protein MalM25_17290 [Planctomycetes bacterium MalM25]
MSKRYSHWRTVALAFATVMAPPLAAHGDLAAWIGGDGVWDASDANWSNNDEPDPDDQVYIGSESEVTMGIDNSVEDIHVNSESMLLTSDYSLNVADLLYLSGFGLGDGGILQLASNSPGASPPLVSLSAGRVEIGQNAELRMAGNAIIQNASGVGDLKVFGGGVLRGNGLLAFTDSHNGAAIPALMNDGKIIVGATASSMLPAGSPPARTLQLAIYDEDLFFDLGGAGGGQVTVTRNATLDVDGWIADFDGALNLYHNSTFDSSNNWKLGSAAAGPGVITVDNGEVPGVPGLLIPATPADVAYIKGGLVIIDHADSVIDIVDLDGALTFDAPVIANEGSIYHSGTMTFNANTIIGHGFNLLNTNHSHLIVNATTTVNDANWDWDSTGNVRKLTIGADGSLVANLLDPTADDQWGAQMTLDGGRLEVNTANGFWGQNTGSITVTDSSQTGIGVDPPPNASRITGDHFVQTNGTFHVENLGHLKFNSKSTWGASLEVNGHLELLNSINWAGANVTGQNFSGLLDQKANAVVTANTTIGVHTFDWGGGDTTINPGVTFTVDVDSVSKDSGSDWYDNGSINVNGGVLDVTVGSDQWVLAGTSSSNAGVLNLTNNGAGIPVLQGSEVATVGSGQIRVDGGASIGSPLLLSLGVNSTPATGLLITGSGGVVNAYGKLTLAGGDLRDDIDRSLFNATYNLLDELEVTGDSTVDVETFLWSSSDGTKITPGGFLRMKAAAINLGPNPHEYDRGAFRIEGGTAEFDLAGTNSWTMDGSLFMQHKSGSGASLRGDFVYFGDDDSSPADRNAKLTVTGGGQSVVYADAMYYSDASVSVASDSTLVHAGSVTFNGVDGGIFAEFEGPGNLILAGTNTFNETTFLEFSGGTVALDKGLFSGGGGGGVLPSSDTYIHAPVTIEAASIDSYGFSTTYGETTTSDLYLSPGGKLTINLDSPSTGWQINSYGSINYAGGSSSLHTFLAGSDLELWGEMTVSGKGRSGARIDIHGAINIFSTPSVFQLGGNLGGGPNRLEGGSIYGPGTLRAGGATDLVGYGDIDSTIDFDGTTSDLLADDGTLVINGDLLDVGTFGTADADGVLEVTNPWNTLIAHQVVLNGGQIQGAKITNAGANGIVGHGQVSAQVVNNTKIEALGGTLTLFNAGDQLDGLNNAGFLHANTGDFVVQYPYTYPVDFFGTVRVETGREFFAENAEMAFGFGAALELNEGAFRSNVATSFGGALEVASGQPSSLDSDTEFVFEALSSSVLNADLHLAGSTDVLASAGFSGAGDLVNTSAGLLRLANGAVLGVDLVNEGLMHIGNSPGQASAVSFAQSASGAWQVELDDSNHDDYDSLEVFDSAQLAGTLSVVLGYSAQLGETFEVLTAVNGVSGAFDQVDFSLAQLDPGLGWQISYLPNAVELAVVAPISTVPGDYNNDGVVDAVDYSVWRDHFNTSTLLPNDPTAGSVTNEDYEVWKANYGQTASAMPMPTSPTAVPEPTAWLLVILGATGGAVTVRRR